MEIDTFMLDMYIEAGGLLPDKCLRNNLPVSNCEPFSRVCYGLGLRFQRRGQQRNGRPAGKPFSAVLGTNAIAAGTVYQKHL